MATSEKETLALAVAAAAAARPWTHGHCIRQEEATENRMYFLKTIIIFWFGAVVAVCSDDMPLQFIDYQATSVQ